VAAAATSAAAGVTSAAAVVISVVVVILAAVVISNHFVAPRAPAERGTAAMNKDCIYCQRVAAAAELSPTDVVWQFPHSVAFLGPWQYYHGYCILAARSHATELSQLDDTARRAFLDEMCLLARAMEACFQPKKLNYELLGNQVPHLHWHVVPRYADDPEASQPIWFALHRAETNKQERERLLTAPMADAATADALRQELRRLTRS